MGKMLNKEYIIMQCFGSESLADTVQFTLKTSLFLASDKGAYVSDFYYIYHQNLLFYPFLGTYLGAWICVLIRPMNVLSQAVNMSRDIWIT